MFALLTLSCVCLYSASNSLRSLSAEPQSQNLDRAIVFFALVEKRTLLLKFCCRCANGVGANALCCQLARSRSSQAEDAKWAGADEREKLVTMMDAYQQFFAYEYCKTHLEQKHPNVDKRTLPEECEIEEQDDPASIKKTIPIRVPSVLAQKFETAVAVVPDEHAPERFLADGAHF